jgi:hypothetical protein
VGQLAKSSQPLVPERVFLAGGTGSPGESAGGSPGAAQGVLGVLLNLLVAEKSGFSLSESTDNSALREMADRMAAQALETMEGTAPAEPGGVVAAVTDDNGAIKAGTRN